MSTPKQHVADFNKARRARSRDFMARVMNETRNIVVRKLTGEVLNRRSGRLVSSISTRVSRRGNSITGSIGTGVGYGVMWETTGHRAYTVTARNAKALKIPVGGGQFIFRKRARIPAQRPRPFIKPSVKEVQPFLRALHERYFRGLFPARPVRIDIRVKS